MKSALKTAIAVLGLMIAASGAWGQSQADGALARGHRRGARINAALLFSGGENARCQTGNINDAWVVTVSDQSGLSRYISGSGEGGCFVLPITERVGTQVTVTGVLQDTTAIPGSPGLAGSAISISEDCLNVEGFSAGLAANSGSEFDPNDPDNIVNTQGFGFFWYDSDSDLKPGPYSYTVAGCSNQDCPTATVYYNSDSIPGAPPSCTVLSAFPATAQKNSSDVH
jgi:hypothetical protein